LAFYLWHFYRRHRGRGPGGDARPAIALVPPSIPPSDRTPSDGFITRPALLLLVAAVVAIGDIAQPAPTTVNRRRPGRPRAPNRGPGKRAGRTGLPSIVSQRCPSRLCRAPHRRQEDRDGSLDPVPKRRESGAPTRRPRHPRTHCFLPPDSVWGARPWPNHRSCPRAGRRVLRRIRPRQPAPPLAGRSAGTGNGLRQRYRRRFAAGSRGTRRMMAGGTSIRLTRKLPEIIGQQGPP
jgi:hypothetical protein